MLVIPVSAAGGMVSGAGAEAERLGRMEEERGVDSAGDKREGGDTVVK
ncbi:hypothetical protein IMZ48_33570 [Candidatus Bathyarchaeota archaeon]|nr:hypothetical protein [Candidatus Bathyarchaeota archaeon]